MRQQIVFASQNAGKHREIQALLPEYHIIQPATLHHIDIPETGKTFVENALIKARFWSQQMQMPVLADDSGLMVDVLHGQPGIHSARYAGADANDEDNLTKLLNAMTNQSNRAAQFVCCVVFLRHADDPLPIIAYGQWHGQIATSAQGAEGFGYDPIFWLPEAKKTVAQLSAGQKNQISHRGRALANFKSQLQQEFKGHE